MNWPCLDVGCCAKLSIYGPMQGHMSEHEGGQLQAMLAKWQSEVCVCVCVPVHAVLHARV
eukprot:14128839-Alexandrium_andersonii.AAC.1